MLMPVSETNFLEVSAHVSLKVATKGSFRGKKTLKFSIVSAFFLKQKRGSATKKIGKTLIRLSLICLVEQHIFWV